MKTKFFRVAVEGATTDGRTIDGKWLQEMSDTYNRETYAARVNLEHIRGVTADGPFQAYGDVLSLKTDKVALDVGGKTEQRLALFAEIDALDPLVAMNKKRQKLYSSVEIQPNFAGSGKAYLVGLAVTDSPASLGTEILQFAAQQAQAGKESPLAARKQDPANLFSAAEPAVIEFAEGTAPADAGSGILHSIKDLLVKLTSPAPAAAAVTPPAAAPAAAPAADTGDAANFAAFGEVLTKLATGIDAFTKATDEKFTALGADVSALKETVESTPATGFTQRPLATGNDGGARTDC